jgi:hypothetical protein
MFIIAFDRTLQLEKERIGIAPHGGIPNQIAET